MKIFLSGVKVWRLKVLKVGNGAGLRIWVI